MTSRPGIWTRRAFTQSAALSSVASVLWPSSSMYAELTHAYVASHPGGKDAPGLIRTFAIKRGVWHLEQALACPAPAHLEQHPTLPVLYAVHDVAQWDHRPRGAVSAFAIDATSGRLTLKATEPLALSATYPRHAVVSGDGRDLVVAAHGGGAYNVLPLTAEGLPGAPRLIRKEVGRAHAGPDEPARPTRILPHPLTNRLITADTGNQTIASFALEADSMPALGRMHFHPGMELADVALSPCERWAFVLHVAGAISTHPLDPSGAMGQRVSVVSTQAAESGRMAIHPGGTALITTGTHQGEASLRVWRVDARRGSLTLKHTVKLDETLGRIIIAPGGDWLLATELKTAAIVGIPLAGLSLRPGASRVLARVEGATSISLRVV